MKKLICFILFANTLIAVGQNIGIGTSAPDASAKLDITDANRGLLIPRVNLTSIIVASPVTAPTNGLLVFNLATAGTAPNNVIPGFYYWFSGSWIRLQANNVNDWNLLGNALTSPATNFMGSTDNVDVVFKTNNTEAFRMTNAQRLGIGITTPTTKLEVSSGTADAIYGHSSSVGGYLGYETNFSFGTPLQNISGAGVYASNPAAGYASAFAQSTGAATVAANINFSNVWMANYNYVQNGSPTYNPSASYNQLNVTNASLGGTQIALRGWNERGTTAGNPGFTVGVQGIANSQNQDGIGVEGIAFSSAGIRMGGYFEGLDYAGTSQAYAYVGGTINSGATLRKIVGTGTVSEIVPTPNHGRVTLTAPESPEYWYQDYGTVQLVNGKAHVTIDPILAEIIFVNDEHPLRVFCTPVDMDYFNGITVKNKSATGFDLVELNGGTHSGSIDYQFIAKPKTNYGEGRFPQAPGPAFLKPDMEPAAAKTSNQPKFENVFHWKTDWETYGYNPEDMVPVGEVIPAGSNKGKIKLGNGKYLDYMPADKSSLTPK